MRAFLDGDFKYKGYIIQPAVLCFNLRYFVYGEGFTYRHYEDICEAQKAVDKYIARKFWNDKLDTMSTENGIDKKVLLESLLEILVEL